MNKKLAISMVAALFMLVGCTVSGPKLASSVEDIEGTWEGAEGIAAAYQFNEDGTWSEALSVDRLDDPYSEGEFWFEEMNFHIMYTSGFEVLRCGEPVGTYEIEIKESGNLSFTVIEDECQVRVDTLQGNDERGEVEWVSVP